MKQVYTLKLGLLFYLVVVSSIMAFGQTGSIKGTIRDEKGQPVPGASITLKTGPRTVGADAKGAYALPNLAYGTYSLSISYIGYEPQEREVDVRGEETVDFNLVFQSTALDQVVVVGYGTQRAKDVTGSISTIGNKDLNPGAITNPLQQIAGRAAGVNVSQTGSEPGTAPSVRIRGIGSLIGGNDPLVVVDGVQGNMDLLNQVSPSEIENVDILKDASATAIYGSRGAPGVIIVTTKKYAAGNANVEYNGSSAIDFIPKKLKQLDAAQWWEQAQIYGVPASANHGANTDWFDILTQNGNTQNHTVAITGGSNNFNYRASLNAIAQNGIVIRSGNQNYIGRIQATQKALDDKLTITMNLNSSVRNTTGSPNSVGRASFTSNLISNAYVSRPTDPVFDTDGSYYADQNVFQYINPYAVAQTVVNEGTSNNLFGNMRVDLEIAQGLTAGVFGSWRKVDNQWGYFLPVSSTVASAIDNQGIANINNSKQDERLFNASLNYKKTIDDHYFDVIGVYEWQNQSYQGNFTQSRGFINDLTAYHALQLGDLSRVVPGDFSSYKNDRALVSFLGRVNYALLDRYLLTASFRRDGSTVFGANHKWGNFPSVSAAWRIDQEPFMANQTLFESIKLRGGYGITGNQQGLYPQGSIQLVGAAGLTYFGGQQINNYAITQNANADLQWETKYQTNLAIDLTTRNNKLSATLEAYTATTENLLFNYTVPQPPYPFGSIVANVGSMRNRGLEASLTYHVIDNDHSQLSLTANGSWIENKVLNMSGTINGVPLNTDYVGWGPNSFLVTGKPIGSFYILQHDGKDENNKELVVDQNSDGIIDQGARSPDRIFRGSALPTYTYAFIPSYTYKKFDVSMVWRGSGGNMIYNNLRQSLSLFENLGRSNILESAIPLGLYTTEYGSDLWLEDGSFVRLENATLGYRFDVSKLRHLNSLRVSLTGNNLLLFTKYTGIDPELNVSGGNGFGGDGGIYPRTRSITLGLNITFK